MGQTRLFSLLAFLVVLGFGYPPISEQAGGECDALERLSVRLMAQHGPGRIGDLALAQMLQSRLSQGSVITMTVQQQYPRLPPVVACTMLYWKAVLTPEDYLRDLAHGS